MAPSDDPSMTSEAGSVPITLVPGDEVEAVLDGLPPAQATWARANGFTGKLGQTARLPDGEGRLAGVLFGWGDAATRARERFHLGDFSRTAPAGRYRLATPLDADAAEEAALGWRLGRYRFDRYKPGGEKRVAELQPPDGVDATRLEAIADGVCLTRDLINTPANDMGPVTLEAKCRELAARHGAAIAVTVGDDLLAANFPMIHAVGRAGGQPPRLIEIAWGDPGQPKVTLVGKGVCFDTGGLDLKPAASMALMKKDMGGAATALGLAHMVMALGLPVRLRVLVPAVENSVSATSMRPGDVLASRLGRTVEINNTDAEGRLVLADALALGAEDDPRADAGLRDADRRRAGGDGRRRRALLHRRGGTGGRAGRGRPPRRRPRLAAAALAGLRGRYRAADRRPGQRAGRRHGRVDHRGVVPQALRGRHALGCISTSTAGCRNHAPADRREANRRLRAPFCACWRAASAGRAPGARTGVRTGARHETRPAADAGPAGPGRAPPGGRRRGGAFRRPGAASRNGRDRAAAACRRCVRGLGHRAAARRGFRRLRCGERLGLGAGGAGRLCRLSARRCAGARLRPGDGPPRPHALGEPLRPAGAEIADHRRPALRGARRGRRDARRLRPHRAGPLAARAADRDAGRGRAGLGGGRRALRRHALSLGRPVAGGAGLLGAGAARPAVRRARMPARFRHAGGRGRPDAARDRAAPPRRPGLLARPCRRDGRRRAHGPLQRPPHVDGGRAAGRRRRCASNPPGAGPSRGARGSTETTGACRQGRKNNRHGGAACVGTGRRGSSAPWRAP